MIHYDDYDYTFATEVTVKNELVKDAEVAFLNEEAQDALDRQVRRVLSAKWCDTMRIITLVAAVTGCIVALSLTTFAGIYFVHHGLR